MYEFVYIFFTDTGRFLLLIIISKAASDKVFLSFLKRERERDFANVSNRLPCTLSLFQIV
jgi:hypothetical protein